MEHGGPSGPPETAEPRAHDTTIQRVRVLLRASGFRRYFLARGVSQVGDGLFQLAAIDVLLLQDPGDAPVLKLFVLTAVMLIPFSVISPFSGVFIDRWERRTILTVVPAARAVLAALLPVAAVLGTDSIVFFTVVLVVLSANRFFLATMGAVLPQLVDEEDLLVANSVSGTGGSVAHVLGLGLGAATAGLVGGTQAAVVAAVAFAVSAFTAHRVPVHRGLPPHPAPLLEEVAEVIRQMREGVRAVRLDPRVMYALGAIGVVQFLVGVTTAALYFAFIVILGLSVGSATGVLGVLAVGISVGIVFVPFLGRRVRHDTLIPVSFVAASLGVLVAVGEVSRTRLTLGTFFVGVAYAFAKIPVDTIVQEEMADQIRGRAFAAYDMLFNMTRVAGVGVAALLYELGATTGSIIAGVGVAYLAAAAVFAARERALARRGWIPTPSDLLQPGEVITVRAYEGYRADEEPRALIVGGHELPIEGIDWRAVVEEDGVRAHVFVVRVAGSRVRLAHRDGDDTGWEIERVTPAPPVGSTAR
jgi:MFS family permease